MNWFVVALIVLQIGAAGQYAWDRKFDSAALFVLFALTNVVLLRMGK